MAALPAALREAVECSICLEPCKQPYRLPCEHFFCREPCLQALLNEAQPTCPNCRLAFSEADVEPFHLLGKLLDLLEKSSEAFLYSDVLICPICVKLVPAPLRRSEHFSDLVCGDCSSTGETLRKLSLDEACEEEEEEHSRSFTYGSSEEDAAQDDHQTRGGEKRPYCFRRADTSLQATTYYSEPVHNECKRSAEELDNNNGNRNRSDTVAERENGYFSYISSEKENGDRVIYIERVGAPNPLAPKAAPLPSKTNQHAVQNMSTSTRQGIGRSAGEATPPQFKMRSILPGQSESHPKDRKKPSAKKGLFRRLLHNISKK